MKGTRNHFEHGQSLVLVALSMFVFMGLLALAIDGAYGFAMRRAMQNAADAGALAGARELCIGNSTLVVPRAQEYAITRNPARIGTPQTASVSVSSYDVTVNTSITFPTMFARVMGQNTLTATGTATAGCFEPGAGTGVLPIAWSCRPPITGSDSLDCAIQYGDTDLYVVMDSDPTEDDLYCQDPPNSGIPAGTVDCDLDDDGFDELLAGGNRSWLDLSGGGGGASDLSDWILNGFDGTINTHTWLGGQTGVANSVFQTAALRAGDDVVIPVFDIFSTGVPATTHPEDTIVLSGGTSTLYYHIISFSVFHITCVEAPGVPGTCPGHRMVVDAGLIRNNVRTIEGYFVEGYDPGLSGRPSDGVDAGAFTIYLTR